VRISCEGGSLNFFLHHWRACSTHEPNCVEAKVIQLLPFLFFTCSRLELASSPERTALLTVVLLHSHMMR
jgi:hypothetical protein